MSEATTVEVKSHVERTYPLNHPARAVFAALPDRMDAHEFDATLPLLVRVLRMRGDPGGPP
jgi:hypothetical protein